MGFSPPVFKFSSEFLDRRKDVRSNGLPEADTEYFPDFLQVDLVEDGDRLLLPRCELVALCGEFDNCEASFSTSVL